MASTARPLAHMTVEEFLAWDGGDHQGKLELVDGVVLAMAPANPTHGTIQTNIASLLKRHFDERKHACRAVIEPGVLPRIRSRHNTRVPDIGVTCTPDVRGEQLLPDPLLLVEILSPGNSDKTWRNVWTYVTIPTVQEILIVHGMRIKAELLRKDASGVWPEESETVAAGEAIRLASIDCVLPIGDVYEGTYLAEQG